MNNTILKLAAFLGALSVALGAFAAHGLKKLISEKAVETFQTGVTYQFYHVFALLAAGILFRYYKNKFIQNASIFFLLGILLFSGSLYLLTLKEYLQLESLQWVVFITPFGGVCFMVGWMFLLLGIKEN
ncbi:MAG TPA: DUF423 domain-containing protein [Chitinophagaceae bacterium]|nr:DUF423 domain-containing protein [Chitinophagaceae bacterium]HNM34794.1 DUF423 domain-containing protein [Chitinophagaceae bacterium]